jgi:hypothetical protein
VVFIAVLPFIGLAKRCPKTREITGIYGAGLTINMPGKLGTSKGSLHAATSFSYGLKGGGESEEDRVGWISILL